MGKETSTKIEFSYTGPDQISRDISFSISDDLEHSLMLRTVEESNDPIKVRVLLENLIIPMDQSIKQRFLTDLEYLPETVYVSIYFLVIEKINIAMKEYAKSGYEQSLMYLPYVEEIIKYEDHLGAKQRYTVEPYLTTSLSAVLMEFVPEFYIKTVEKVVLGELNPNQAKVIMWLIARSYIALKYIVDNRTEKSVINDAVEASANGSIKATYGDIIADPDKQMRKENLMSSSYADATTAADRAAAKLLLKTVQKASPDGDITKLQVGNLSPAETKRNLLLKAKANLERTKRTIKQ